MESWRASEEAEERRNNNNGGGVVQHSTGINPIFASYPSDYNVLQQPIPSQNMQNQNHHPIDPIQFNSYYQPQLPYPSTPRNQIPYLSLNHLSQNPTLQNHQNQQPVDMNRVPLNPIGEDYDINQAFSLMNLSTSRGSDLSPLDIDRFHTYQYQQQQQQLLKSLLTMRIQSAARETHLRSLGFNSLDQSTANLQRGGYSVRTNLDQSGIRLDSSRGRSINGVGSNLLSSRKQYSNNYSMLLSLDHLRGQICLLAKEPQGCVFLQRKLEDRKPEEIYIIFMDLKDNLSELIKDPSGNFVVQKLFEVCNEEQLTQLLLWLTTNEHRIISLCTDHHGTRVVQKMVECITTQEQISLLVSVLKQRHVTLTLTKNGDGHHVIQQCLRFFSNVDIKDIMKEIAENCLDIATNKSGCCVLQQCLSYAPRDIKDRLVADITANALSLSGHPYGNYVVQFLLAMGMPQVTAEMVAKLEGSYVSLSLDKFGSHVVEKCLRESGVGDRSRIIQEMIYSPDFLKVLQDPFGNFVAQSALEVSKGDIHDILVSCIVDKSAYLQSHLHGKRVLAHARASKRHVARFV
ncbi:pumilio 12-like [Tripterygium wilfordii]|uniref:Pumilio 12-like n=3 Tax=Tripterygium wilfordii TaxID=458696 RepID=A0A7J7DYA7_TRIWF|nr:pumilio 12-like [Tripterygium wilfordii]